MTRVFDEIDVTGWGVWMGHAIPVEVARHIANKINERVLEQSIAAPKASAPEGWVMVPKEQTAEMKAAAEKAWMNRNLHDPESAPIRDSYLANLAAAPTPPAASTLDGPVASVVWYDPALYPFESKKPRKIIDASLAFMDDAPIGTPLYAAAPTPPAVTEAREFWMTYDDQGTGGWCITEEPPKVTRFGAEVIHVREVSAAIRARSAIAPEEK